MRQLFARRRQHDAWFRQSTSRRSMVQAGGVGLLTTMMGMGRAHPGFAQEATPTSEDGMAFSPETRVALTDIVLSTLAATYTPGAIVGIWYPGQGTWMLAAGIGDLKTAAPMRLEDHFRIASISKTFVATVVLQLVEEGALSLDDHLGQFVSGIPNGDEITIRQLLNMSGGIYNYIYDPVIAVDYDRDPLLAFTPEQAIEIVRRHGQADFAPGERSVYSDTNYILLGEIIEQVTGRSVIEEIAERTLQPLGLTQTSFATTPDMPEPYAHGYAADEPGAIVRDVTHSNPDVPWAAGAMISTLGDLKIWIDALVSGALLSPALQAERTTLLPWFEEPLTSGYGLGLYELGGLLGHNGGILGYSSWMMQDPESKATIILVDTIGTTEGDKASGLIFGKIADLLFPGRGFDGLVEMLGGVTGGDGVIARFARGDRVIGRTCGRSLFVPYDPMTL